MVFLNIWDPTKKRLCCDFTFYKGMVTETQKWLSIGQLNGPEAFGMSSAISPDFGCEGPAMSFGTHVISSKSTLAMWGGIQGQIIIDMSSTTAYWMEKKGQYTREFSGLYDIRGMEL